MRRSTRWVGAVRRWEFSLLVAAWAALGCARPAAPLPPSPPPAVSTASSPASPFEREAEPANACPKAMVSIPSGTLWLGSPAGRGEANERPEAKVDIGEYCLSQREVSVAQYQACASNKACEALATEVRLLSPLPEAEHKAQSAHCSANLTDNADLPASCVSFEDASRYCAWKGLRLPTEAEWEWAATGGDDKLAWPWGNALPSDENTCWNRRSPCRVGSRAAGAFGLHDLAGGVSEWTNSAYGPYGGTANDPKAKVVRGGSWESVKPDALRPEKRASMPAGYRDVTLGFRCAKDRR